VLRVLKEELVQALLVLKAHRAHRVLLVLKAHRVLKEMLVQVLLVLRAHKDLRVLLVLKVLKEELVQALLVLKALRAIREILVQVLLVHKALKAKVIFHKHHCSCIWMDRTVQPRLRIAVHMH
jgi:hypothetical protein